MNNKPIKKIAVLTLVSAFTSTPAWSLTAEQRLVALESTVATLKTANTNLNTQVTALGTALNKVRSNSVLKLNGKLGLNVAGDTAVFTGINVQVVNGLGTTSSRNGKGNLIVGYNESDINQHPVCTDGQYTDQASCEAASALWEGSQHSGSHYLVTGSYNTYSQYGGIVAGWANAANGGFTSVTGGMFNTAHKFAASVNGGYNNSALEYYSSVSGGHTNTASGAYSSVTGGYNNSATGEASSVTGGGSNIAEGTQASVNGGTENNAHGIQASISGGRSNYAYGALSSISGGGYNEANGLGSTVSGGGGPISVTGINLKYNGNTADGDWSTVSGGQERAAENTGNWVAGSLLQDN